MSDLIKTYLQANQQLLQASDRRVLLFEQE